MVSMTPFSTAGMNCRGIAPPTILSANSKPVPRSSGSTRRNATPNCPWPPVCFLYLPSASAFAGDRLPVRHLDVFGLDLDTQLPVQPLERDAEVRLAHAPQQRLVRLRVALEAQRGILVEQAVQRVGELVLVALRLGADRDRQHGLRRGEGLHLELRARAAEYVAGGGVGELRDGGDVARRHFGDGFLLLAAHDRELVQPFLRHVATVHE